MKKLIAACLVAGSALVGASAASATPLALSPQGDDLVTRVAQGCGPGFGRDAFGRCRPFAQPRFAPRPRPRPVIVAPARPIFVPPRACPRGYVLTPRGVCRARF